VHVGRAGQDGPRRLGKVWLRLRDRKSETTARVIRFRVDVQTEIH